MSEIEIGALEEFEDGKIKGWEGNGLALVLVRRGDEVFALEDVCSHMEVPLSFGSMVEEYVIQCSAHGAKFDIRNGKNLCLPAIFPVKTYRTIIRNGNIFVIID